MKLRKFLVGVLAVSIAFTVNLSSLNINSLGVKAAEAVEGKFVFKDINHLVDVINNPYTDNMGYEFREEYSNPEIREQLLDAVVEFYGEGNPSIPETKAKIESNIKTYEFVKKNKDKLIKTELQLSQNGGLQWDENRARRFYLFENRDFTGLFINPKTESLPESNGMSYVKKDNKITNGSIMLSVFVDTESKKPIQLVMRQIGRADGPAYQNVVARPRNLNKGYNLIELNISDRRYPLALYFRNNSHDKAKVRIAAYDIYNSKSMDLAREYQPVTASPISLGSQLGIYPTFTYDENHKEAFLDYVNYLREYTNNLQKNDLDTEKDYANMTDIRLGNQDISIPAKYVKEVYKSVSENNYDSIITKAYNVTTGRLDFFAKKEGFDKNEPEGSVNAYSRQQVLTVFDSDIKSPSPYYAFNEHYHMPTNSAREMLLGDENSIYSWGHSHEYGHMLDNSLYVIPETTNNLYSLLGATKRYEYMLKINKEAFPEPGQLFHPAIGESDKRIDKWLNNSIKNPSIDSMTDDGSWDNGNIFLRTRLMYPVIRFFETYDYSNYDFKNSPFKRENLEIQKKYGTFGAMLRAVRENYSWAQSLYAGDYENHSKDNKVANQKFSVFVALATYATGFDMTEYFEKMGYKNIIPSVKAFSKKYPSLPVKLEYYNMKADMKRVRNEVLGTNEDFGDDAVVTIDKVEDKDNKKIFNLSIDKNPDDVIAYEIYKNDKLVGFTRNNKFVYTPSEGEEFDIKAFSAKAYDYKLNAKKSIPWIELTPAKKSIPWTELTPAKKSIPWTELIPAKKSIPWTELTPAKKSIPWTELTPAKKSIPWIEIIPTTSDNARIETEQSKEILPWTKLTPAHKVEKTSLEKDNYKKLPKTSVGLNLYILIFFIGSLLTIKMIKKKN